MMLTSCLEMVLSQGRCLYLCSCRCNTECNPIFNQGFGFGSHVPAPPNWNAGDRRIMKPTTDADNTVATRHNNPTAV